MTQDPQQPDRAPSPAPGFPFSPQDALEFMQRMWNPLGIPIPGFAAPAATSPGPAPAGMPFAHPAALFAALGIILIGSVITVIQRIVFVRRQAKQPSTTTPTQSH